MITQVWEHRHDTQTCILTAISNSVFSGCVELVKTPIKVLENASTSPPNDTKYIMLQCYCYLMKPGQTDSECMNVNNLWVLGTCNLVPRPLPPPPPRGAWGWGYRYMLLNSENLLMYMAYTTSHSPIITGAPTVLKCSHSTGICCMTSPPELTWITLQGT